MTRVFTNTVPFPIKIIKDFCKLMFLHQMITGGNILNNSLIYTRSSFGWNLFQRAPYNKVLKHAVTTANTQSVPHVP